MHQHSTCYNIFFRSYLMEIRKIKYYIRIIIWS